MSKRIYAGSFEERRLAAVRASRARNPERAKAWDKKSKQNKKARQTVESLAAENSRRTQKYAERIQRDPEWHRKWKKYLSDYAKAHHKEAAARSKRNRKKLRLQVLAAYGGVVCACCNDTHEEFLAIDHINGGGHKQRFELGALGTKLYDWLRKNNFPPGYQVLCHNCNYAKHFYKVCPHQRMAHNEPSSV